MTITNYIDKARKLELKKSRTRQLDSEKYFDVEKNSYNLSDQKRSQKFDSDFDNNKIIDNVFFYNVKNVKSDAIEYTIKITNNTLLSIYIKLDVNSIRTKIKKNY